ncbi:MAG: hypothetical protein ABJ320_18710 [Lentilitoribacter sp.]
MNTDDWQDIDRHAADVSVPAGHKIQNQAKVAELWIFLFSGIAASEQTWRDGTTTIARFLEPGHICAKTSGPTETRCQFLIEYNGNVLLQL